MHEMTTILSILKQIDAELKKHDFTRVKTIDIVAGAFSGFSEDHLRAHFEMAPKPDYLKGAEVKISGTSATHWCKPCNTGFIPLSPDDACPNCGSSDMSPIFPHSVFLKSLEVE